MIEEVVYGIKTVLLWFALSVGAFVAVIELCMLLGRSWRALRRKLSHAHLSAFLALACACTLLARKGRVTYPRTDADIAYLTDRGSYVTNDFVHIDFARIIVPNYAHVFVDYRQVDMTNDTDWVTLVDSTFAEFSVPTNIPFANATNYDFMVYTTWTPGPAVQTNGVWHAVWGLDKRGKFYLIPVRTAVRVDGEVIATPKSKAEAKESYDEM